MLILRRKFWPVLAICLFLIYLAYSWSSDPSSSGFWPNPIFPGSTQGPGRIDPKVLDEEEYFWRKVHTNYPVEFRPLPTEKPHKLPAIQATFAPETSQEEGVRLQRQQAVRDAFRRCWDSYRKFAWMQDELVPKDGQSRNTFGGWGATLVDSLDTLWIMGLREEFEEAVSAAANISFETSSLDNVNVFETTIRYLGGFLSAYDLSHDPRLLKKAREVGDMVYVAFDTPNHMPITRWDFKQAVSGQRQEASSWALVAEIGSLCMEFTRLSFITGDPKWFDATERISDLLLAQQDATQLPGMWPISVNPKEMRFTDDNTFGLGAMADSVFEYLPKMHAMVGGSLPAYETMYKKSMATAIKSSLFRPMLPDEADILISGTVHTTKHDDGHIDISLEHQGQHLVCFAGGMLAIGSKLFNISEHMDMAKKLVDGCIWTYSNMPLGIMPETFWTTPCDESASTCSWNETRWKEAILEREGVDSKDVSLADQIIAEKRLPKGFTQIPDTRYILRPEAIESVFVLFRTTGRKDLLEAAWAMFEAVQKHTQTKLANSALGDVTVGGVSQSNSMESFWMGETLKYFYLIFSPADLISLDEFVFNTEAHPFRSLGA